MNSEQGTKSFYSVGHSTRSIDGFLELLLEHGVTSLVDIRRFPGSRRHPQFSVENLRESVESSGITYLHQESLGGHRRPKPDSPNASWRNVSFRGYADHMASEEFRSAVDELTSLSGTVAYMCAEAVPWRCHRNLLSDELVRRGSKVIHILGHGSTNLHQINPAARDAGGYLIYGSEESQARLPL